jgi:hypothetical protein
VAAYNHSLKRYAATCCFCSKSAAKSPVLVEVFVDPPESDGIGLAECPHPSCFACFICQFPYRSC